MDFGRNNSFMEDDGGLSLGDNDLFGDDSGDLNRIFDEDDDGPVSLDKPEPKKSGTGDKTNENEKA